MNQHNSSGFNKDLDNKRFEIINQFIKGGYILEVGPGNGHMTQKLRKTHIGIIDTTDNLEKYHNLFKRIYNTILCTNVLEHVSDTQRFLERIKLLGNKKTIFIFSVPNAYSHNRQLGYHLGKIESPLFLDKQDIAVGHKKMYHIEELEQTLTKEGFIVNKSWTQIYKPFPNRIMEKLPKEIKKYCLDMKPIVNGAEIFCICKLK